MKNGGPAFPQHTQPGHFYYGERTALGMTLRDYFAAKAMAALMSCPDHVADGCRACDMTPEVAVAMAAYRVADAMLVEREKGEE